MNFLLFLLCTGLVYARVDFRQTTANKAFIDSLRDGEFEIVHPFQIREKSDRIGIDTRNYFLRGTEHYEQITVVIRSSTLGRLKIVASRNDHLILNQTNFNKLDTNGEHGVTTTIERCYYQGIVAGDHESFAAFSSCHGLRGILALSNGSVWGLHPLDGGDQGGKRHPHVLYRARWPLAANCGTSSALPAMAATHLLQSELSGRQRIQHKHRRDTAKQAKHVELALIADYHFMREHGSDELSTITYILDAINTADLMLQRSLNVKLCVVYMEMWLDVQRIDLFADSSKTLAGLVDYAAGHIYNIPKDATILFTGGKFANSEATTSTFQSVCTARAAAVVKSVGSVSGVWSGQLAAQATGHILGVDHDSSSCACPNCVMNTKPGSVGGEFAWQFSKCSVARIEAIWQSGHVRCLLNKPFQESTLRACGNGVVDGSEECDCGGLESCADPCCDPLTCTLKAHAQCAAHQPCCSRCQLLPSGTECRASRGLCDVSEVCDGRSGDCPADGHLVDGTACGGGERGRAEGAGQCWRGECADTFRQCRAIWGERAEPAHEACFHLNTDTTVLAGCGDGACTVHDQKCGRLHCQGGDVHARIGNRSFSSQFVNDGENIQCKIVVDSVGMVADGSSCGTGRVCVSTSCVEIIQVSSPVTCPTSNVALACSGHGDCTTTSRCVCGPGWTGEACEKRRGPAPSTAPPIVVPSLAVGKALDTSTLLIILLAVGVCLVLLLMCLLVCYRRRSHLDIPLASDEKSVADAIPEASRTIKFKEDLPSYKAERSRKRSNGPVYAALNRINEVDERDSASLRSRESALLSAEQQRPFPSSRSDVGVCSGSLDEEPYAASIIGIGRKERPDYSVDYPFSTSSAAHPGPSSHHDWIASHGHSPPPPSAPSHPLHPPRLSSHHHPLRLNNLNQIMRQLQSSSDEDGGGMRGMEEDELSGVEADLEAAASNTESSRACEDSPHLLMTSEDGKDDNHPASLPFRHSPSLFSDPFKLEMSSSIHT